MESLVFKNVRFTYPQEENNALNDVPLKSHRRICHNLRFIRLWKIHASAAYEILSDSSR